MKTKDNTLTIESLLKSLTEITRNADHVKDRIQEDTVQKDTSQRNISQTITSQSDTAQGGIAQRDPAKRDTFQRNSAQKETVRKEKVTGNDNSIVSTALTNARRDPGNTELIREITPERNNTGDQAGIARIFAESSANLKILTFVIPVSAFVILFILLKTGILLNPSTGKNDSMKVLFCITGLALICFEVERIIWKNFARRFIQKTKEATSMAGEETVFLYGNDTEGYPFSLVSDDQPAINVSHFPFFVGKDPGHCDYVMTSQVGVSRYHMKIDRDGDEFTISDLNSTNGTYINGERLAPHLPHKIRRGDELKIGKCIYYCN